MNISNVASVVSNVRAYTPQTIDPNRQTLAPTGVTDGNDKENDGDSDDGRITATRGQNLNIKA